MVNVSLQQAPSGEHKLWVARPYRNKLCSRRGLSPQKGLYKYIYFGDKYIYKHRDIYYTTLEVNIMTLQRENCSLKALGEQIKTLKGEFPLLQQETRVKKSDVTPTCGFSVPSHTELCKADQVLSNWSALPGFESKDSDSSDERCLRPTRTQALKGSKKTSSDSNHTSISISKTDGRMVNKF